MKKKNEAVPRHVGIIMDGNGRWAKARLMPRLAGHAEGMKRVVDIVRHASNRGVEVLTLYAFSTENWKRPDEEVSGLMKLLIQYVESQLKTLIEEEVKVRVIGDMTAFSIPVREAMERAIERTKDLNGMTLNLALNYGGRAEIVRAYRRIQETGTVEFTEETIQNALDTAGQPDLDLIIRTGGDQRLSNFLLYQAAYAELVFLDTLWPDFREPDLDRTLDLFQKRDRRFGEVK